MASSFPGVIRHAGVLAPVAESKRKFYHTFYNQHCHRIYSLAFWMTDNELVAEQLAQHTFLRAFALNSYPRTENLDEAFLAEVRELTPVGALTLAVQVGSKGICGSESGFTQSKKNVKRVYLERAVVQVPATERLIFLLFDVEGYDHERIGNLLGITADESRLALHQARLRIRELVSQMQ
jgi:RNA polymerase sigma-70 factor, ECF subfamily